MWSYARRGGAFPIGVPTSLAIVLVVGISTPSFAQEGKWSFEFGAMSMDAYGHDQHVLTIHEIDLDATPRTDRKTAINLDTDAEIAYRTEFQYTRGKWGLGADFFLLLTSQSGENLTAAAGPSSGTLDEVIFEVADRSFTSSDPSQVLFYGVLEDTDLEAWTLDLYGIRTLSEVGENTLDLMLGVRFGDFDNDYRAVVGIEGVGGSRLDASSNYGRMTGPIVGLAGNIRHGRASLQGSIGQSVLFGSAELSTMSREFTGTFSGETSSFFAQESFEKKQQDVAIPITEVRIKLGYKLTEFLSLGAGVHSSTWWDVPVPPGVTPIADGDEAFHENTIVFFGVLGSVKLTF
jgi:hypothetical protein